MMRPAPSGPVSPDGDAEWDSFRTWVGDNIERLISLCGGRAVEDGQVLALNTCIDGISGEARRMARLAAEVRGAMTAPTPRLTPADALQATTEFAEQVAWTAANIMRDRIENPGLAAVGGDELKGADARAVARFVAQYMRDVDPSIAESLSRHLSGFVADAMCESCGRDFMRGRLGLITEVYVTCAECRVIGAARRAIPFLRHCVMVAADVEGEKFDRMGLAMWAALATLLDPDGTRDHG